MKLQTQYNRVTLIATLFTLVIAAFGFYFLLKYVLNRQLDEALKVEEAEIYDYINKYNRLPEENAYKDQTIEFMKTDHPEKRHFKNLPAFHTKDGETESSRQLVFSVNVSGQYYLALVTISIESTQELIGIVLLVTIGLTILLVALLFFANRFLLKKLWRPFHSTLSSIRNFNLSAPAPIQMEETNISEFSELNNNIRIMAGKVTSDYQSLKSFTDHASHEMQTPLAVINSKLDTLIQQPQLNEKSMENIQQIYNAVDKLSRLSQSLLLLARIENKQYSATQPVRLDKIIIEMSENFHEWTESKQVSITIQADPLTVSINKELAEILIGNLFKNAIKHSEPAAKITIRVLQNEIVFCNSGKMPLDTKKIFERFHKSERSDGSGLGLAIVKQICDQYNFKLRYIFSEDTHCFSISLN